MTEASDQSARRLERLRMEGIIPDFEICGFGALGSDRRAVTKPPTVFPGEMTNPELEAFLTRHRTVIMPTGATERDGPHGPRVTDRGDECRGFQRHRFSR